MARMGETCGAVTGAFMVIGLKHGSAANWLVEGRVDDRENGKRLNTYRLVRELTDRFAARHGSIRCKDLLGCDLSTPEGGKMVEEKNLFRTVCPGLVRDAAEILEEIL
jgi:C_GCAxxG_C_C family probable redox protein